MKKLTKILLITATALVLIGAVIFAGGFLRLKSDFKHKINTYEITESFKNLSINTDTADITIKLSDNTKSKIVCYETNENVKHSVNVQNDTLEINLNDNRKWYDYIEINFGSPKIEIYLPIEDYSTLNIKEDTGDIEIANDFAFKNVNIALGTGDVNFYANAEESIKIKGSTSDITLESISAGALNVSTSTGHIYLKNMSADKINLSTSTGDIIASGVTCKGDAKLNVSTGKITISDTECKNLITDGSTGDISLKNVLAGKKFSIKRSTGDIKFNACDADEIFILTDTGDVKGSLLSSKIFLTNTDTGNIDVPKTTTGGKCEITTDTGDIRLTVK